VHDGGNIGVSEAPMKSLRIPRRDAGSVFAPGSPVRLGGARSGSSRPTVPRRQAGDFGKRLPARRSVTAFALRRTRTVGAFAASAGVVPVASDSAGHGLRVRDGERGGFGPLRR
jgi:hypothetical protein